MMKTEEILSSDHVLRRINERVIDSGRVSSSCFHDRDDEPSVHLERIADLKIIMEKHPDTLLWGRLNVGEIRSAQLGDVRHDPTEDDYSHCLIVRTISTEMNKKRRAKELLRLITGHVHLINGAVTYHATDEKCPIK